MFTATQQWLDSFCIWVFEDYWYSNVYSKDNIEFLISEVRRVISLGQCGPLHTPIQSNHPSALAAGVVHTTHYSLTPLWLYKQAHLIFVVLSSFFFLFPFAMIYQHATEINRLINGCRLECSPISARCVESLRMSV